MTDQEALRRWLRIAWEKGRQVRQLCLPRIVDYTPPDVPPSVILWHGTFLATMTKEFYEARYGPLPQPSLAEATQEVNDKMLSWGDKGKMRLPL